jgi:hypothetical protein
MLFLCSNGNRFGCRHWLQRTQSFIIRFEGMAMSRATQFTIGRYMVAVAIIAYFSAFHELAILLGILIASLLFVAPVLVIVYFACRFSLRHHRLSNASHIHSTGTAGNS